MMSPVREHVLLLRPKSRHSSSRIYGLEQLGLSYVAAAIRSVGLTARIVDGFLSPKEYDDVLASVKGDHHSLIGFAAYGETARRVARDVKQIRSQGVGTHVTIGGHLATLAGVNLLDDFPVFDSVVRGEGELTAVELAKAIVEDRRLSHVAGLTFRDGDTIKKNHSRPNIDDLDSLPFPARDTLPLVIEQGNPALVYSSRGCNGTCEFCSVRKFFDSSPNPGYRARSPSNVVDEIQYLVDSFGIREIAFADEQFMGHGEAGEKRALRIAKEIIKRHLKINWYIETRASSIKLNIFNTLRQAGLRAVFVGIESGCESALIKMRKNSTPMQNRRAIEVLKKLEILPSVGFIMFRPDTTIEELSANLELFGQMGCGELSALSTGLRVYTGTDVEARLNAEGNLFGSYLDYSWRFQDDRIHAISEIVRRISPYLSATFNEFARIRRSGRLTFEESLELQQAINSLPLSVLGRIVADVNMKGKCSIAMADRAVKKLINACEESLAILRFTDAMVRKRDSQEMVQTMQPTALC